MLASMGMTILLPIAAMAGCGQVGASFAVYLKSKNKFLKRTILSSLPVGMLGIGEPLIYGVTLPLGKPLSVPVLAAHSEAPGRRITASVLMPLGFPVYPWQPPQITYCCICLAF
ncbi:MAG: hypothetical protein II419_04235, partial [Acidaminococcaceae bacterium]|nr:hypothetical protein [Acidaminococcaceae bacterium]